jgi:hypothetical protein
VGVASLPVGFAASVYLIAEVEEVERPGRNFSDVRAKEARN